MGKGRMKGINGRKGGREMEKEGGKGVERWGRGG